MTIKIGINGLGRIGRMVIRAIIESKNNTGDKLGVLKIEEIGIGRTEQNAYLKTKNKLQDQIKRNLDKINLK